MLKNMKLAMKLGLSFGLMIILTIVMAYVGHNGMGGIENRVDKADDVNRMVRIILETRMSEKNYILRSNNDYLQKHRELIATLKEQIKTTNNKFSQKVNHDQMAELGNAVDKYESAFGRYV